MLLQLLVLRILSLVKLINNKMFIKLKLLTPVDYLKINFKAQQIINSNKNFNNSYANLLFFKVCYKHLIFYTTPININY